MDANTQQLCSEMARYIEYTQPQLDKAAEIRGSLGEYRIKIAEAIDNLVDKGLVSLQEKVSVYNDLANHPEKSAELLCKISNKTSGYSPLGGPADRLNGEGLDSILSFCLGDL